MQKLGLFLFIVSFLPWLAIFFVVPFLPLSIALKTTIDVVLAVVAEICFWLSVLLLGKEVVTKYRRYFHPRYLWRRWKIFHRRWTRINADISRIYSLKICKRIERSPSPKSTSIFSPERLSKHPKSNRKWGVLAPVSTYNLSVKLPKRFQMV